MRLFVAIDVPEDLKDALDRDIVETLRPSLPGARWTRPEGRHLTLKFLGNVDDERVDEMEAAVRSAAAGHRAFDGSFEEVGGFPTLRRPRVLWVGIGEGSEQMHALASDLEDAFAGLGFEREDRPFSAHLTLARFPRPRIVEGLPQVTVPGEAFRVADVVLFRSQLHPKGARYTALSRVPLDNP